MKKTILSMAFLFCKLGFGGVWYTIPLSSFNNVSYNSTLTVQSVAPVTVTKEDNGTTSTPSISQVDITPPSGKENRYLAMILAAASTGARIRVTGTDNGGIVTCNAGSIEVVF